AVWPKSLTEFVAHDEIARPLQQQRQDLESLFLEGDPHSGFPQFARSAVQFKFAKPDKARRRVWHARSSAQGCGNRRGPRTRGRDGTYPQRPSQIRPNVTLVGVSFASGLLTWTAIASAV